MSHSNIKPAQLSIRSFFQPKGPQYAPPPSKISNLSNPPPPAAVATPPAAAPPRSVPLPAQEDEPAPPPAATSAIPPLPVLLPREASIRLVTRDDLNALRRINALLLPVSYSDSFYQHAVDPVTGRFSRVITWAHDGSEPKVVGGVVCQIEPKLNAAGSDNGEVPHNIYIQSLCLLSPYRSLGLVNAAVDNIVAAAVADPTLTVTTLTAHVWTENEEGLKWYQARGFQYEEQPIRGYYMKLRPDSAWLVTRPVAASVRNSLPSKSSAPSRSTTILSTTAAVLNRPTESGPPRAPSAPPLPRGQSYQNQRAETEWNDLPQDMATGRLTAPPRTSTSATGSSSSSRNSSTVRKKRDRSYPAAAFGSQEN